MLEIKDVLNFAAIAGFSPSKSLAEMTSPTFWQTIGYRPKKKREQSKLGSRNWKKYLVAKSVV